MRAIVIGGGIGGVTAALSMARAGIETRVYEQAPAPSEVGAGISLWGNAIRALSHIGIKDDVVAAGDILHVGELRTWKGRVISLMAVGEADRELGHPSVVIHRADLLDILVRHAPKGMITFGAHCAGVRQQDSEVVVRFTGGQSHYADTVVGADGINSQVRAAVLGSQPVRYSGYTCWRGVVEYPIEKWPSGHAAEVWGRGMRFGITRIGHGRVYWWATRNARPNGRDGDVHKELLSYFRGWWEPVTDLLRHTPPSQIIRSDINDRPPTHAWGKGRITLLGDAAHATTPNLGQGGCMAIEDGVILARHIARAHRGIVDVTSALRAYEEERYPRTTMVTNMSWKLGRVGQWSNPVMCALRDFFAGLTPQFMFRQNHRQVVGFPV
jgi:2-polyprenyl-6-methoxyphenol hydroxylase-like FAD-dependent oxidoreductase